MNVTDRSGGAAVLLCGRCRVLLEHERCRLCGSPKIGASKAEHIHEMEPPGEAASGPLCDNCREGLFFRRTSQC